MAIGYRGGDDSDMYGSNEGWSTEVQDLHDAEELLKECLRCFNSLRNQNYDKTEDTYSLASKVTKFLRR